MILFLFSWFFALEASAQSQPEALSCVEKFIEKMASTKGYSLRMQKRELSSGKWLEEPIEIWSEGQQIKYKFVADGSTGIKNNGMTLIYNGTETLNIIWGEPTFLGAIANKAAKAVTGDTLQLLDSKTLKGEIFTLNRAGYRHLAACLKYHLPALKAADAGGLKTEKGCKLKHTPPHVEYATVNLSPGVRIQDLEEKYGTFGYHIREVNAEKFPTLEALFKHTGEQEIRVPLFFLPFELDIDPETGFPSRLVIYLEGQKIGEYEFTQVKGW